VTPALWINRVARPLVIIAGAVPAAWVGQRFFRGDVPANPAEYLEHYTGTAALVILLLCLAVTPLRRVTGINPLIRLRKPIGLWAFAYACLHLSCYLVFDQSLDLHEIGKDILKRPYITVGFSAWLILLLLAATSFAWAVRRLGGRRWNTLHRLVYWAAAGGVIHYLWSVKRDVSVPTTLGLILIVLLLARLPRRRPTGNPTRLVGSSG
jgi:sulfoxide reductase heme-binding subunit YedZ